MLFTRNTREVALTDLGAAGCRRCSRRSRGVDAVVDEPRHALAARARACCGSGYLIGTGADLLFRLVRHFEAAYPEVTVEPIEFDFADPTAGLADGSTEVAIIRPPVDLPDHRMLMLDAEYWVACLPRDHRLARPLRGVDHRTARRSDRRARPDRAGPWRDYWLAMDVRGNRPPTIAAVAATYEAETTTIARGLGISFTSVVGRPFLRPPGIVYVPIIDRPPSYTALAWNPASADATGDALVRQVREQWNFGEGAVERPRLILSDH